MITDQDSDEIINVGIEDMIERNKFLQSYNNEIAIIDFSDPRQTQFGSDRKIRLQSLSVIVILNGTISININGNNFHFESNVLFDIMELHVIQQIKTSPDCRGYHLILSPDFTKEITAGMKRFSISNFISRYNYPIEPLTASEAEMLQEIILRIAKSLKRTDHLLHRDLIKNEVRSFFIEVLNIIISKSDSQNKKAYRNKDHVVGEFMRLLHTHCQQEHSVDFYAKKLCIDAKHLSRILKSVSGKTANTWIDEAILEKAKTYLKTRTLSIQQIADTLNFSDQSSFGKFVKKHCGVSPLKYRALNM